MCVLLHTIALMMEVIHTSETSVALKETTMPYIPEGCNLMKIRIYIIFFNNPLPALASSVEDV
jgi:hypothetical protein